MPANDDNLYYMGSKWDLKNPTYYTYAVCGQRNRGKTSYWLQKITEHALEDLKHNKFVFMRRSERQIKYVLEKGLYNPCYNLPYATEFWEYYDYKKTYDGYIHLVHDNNDIIVGSVQDLNKTKGAELPDHNVILFDEYVEPKRSDYKGGEYGVHEPELYGRLVRSLFRQREYHAIWTSNEDSSTNPYHEFFKIPFNTNLYKDKSKGLWFEKDNSPAMKTVLENTPTGKLFSGTKFSAYENGETALDSINNALIAEPPAHCKMLYNVMIFGEEITIWADLDRNIEYVTNKRKFNLEYPLISVGASDMVVDSFFLRFNSDFQRLQKVYYGSGKVRFNNQKTAVLFLNMLSIK